MDTRLKRSAALLHSLPWRVLPDPSGVIDELPRQFVGQVYVGISAVLEWTTRASIIGHSLASLRVGLYPTGVLTDKKRQMQAVQYSEILADSSVPPPGVIVIAHTIGRAVARAIGRST